MDRGEKTDVTTQMGEKMKALERENRELKQADEILRKFQGWGMLPMDYWQMRRLR